MMNFQQPTATILHLAWRSGLFAGLVLLVGCASVQGNAEADSSSSSDTGLSFYEDRLLTAIERKEALEAYAAEAQGSDWPEIQRRFRELAGLFQSIVADNPEQLEARLIYGKFLDHFGDEEGAREQWAEVLRRDPTVAVAHQQLGTYFAEKGDFGRALAYYLTAIEHAPEEAVYHFGVGELLHSYRTGFLEEADFSTEALEEQMLNAFREAARLEPENFVYQFRYGEAFYNIEGHDWETALAHWEQLNERADLNTVQAQAVDLHQARVLGELSRYDEARSAAREVSHEKLVEAREALLEAIDEAEDRASGE